MPKILVSLFCVFFHAKGSTGRVFLGVLGWNMLFYPCILFHRITFFHGIKSLLGVLGVCVYIRMDLNFTFYNSIAVHSVLCHVYFPISTVGPGFPANFMTIETAAGRATRL